MLDMFLKKTTTCQYEKTCEHQTNTCWEKIMTEIHAKPIIDNKFWIVEQDGEKIATLKKTKIIDS